ncbi:unnamed protein product [Amaranthus hypochondriacus]
MSRLLSCTIISFLSTLTILILSSTEAQNSGNITVGKSLTANINGSSWLSPSGDFAFGFYKLPNSNNRFLLAIWYARIPNTVVWYANAGIPVPEGSSLKLTPTDGLTLSDPKGTNLWSTRNELTDTSVVSYGFMNDTGNLALIRSDGSLVWQSFNHPTDTLLPGQSLGLGGVVNSRISETNYTSGRFQVRLTTNGKLIFNVRDLQTGVAYEPYLVIDGENAGQAQRLIYNESGYMYILRQNGSMYNMLQDSYKPLLNSYQRTTISYDGILTWYSIPKRSTHDDWSVAQTVPNNICSTPLVENVGSGICGSNSICSIGEDSRPTCRCPPGYSLVEPNDKYSDCKPDFRLDSCESSAKRVMNGGYKLVRLPSTDFIFNDYKRVNASDELDCQNACLKDCYCAAVNFRVDSDTIGCWMKKAPLSNGRKGNSIPGSAWIKVGNANLSSDAFNPTDVFPPSTKNEVNHLIKGLLGGSISVNFILLIAIGLGILFICHVKQLKVNNDGSENALKEYQNVHCFSYQELREATNGFTEELGRGSFGVVYKGMINGELIPFRVAVKKLDRRSGDTDREFKTEVNVIARTHHKNLVQLVGFCKEDDQRLLVYEYMSKGSLADYIFGDSKPSWLERIEIAQGIASGLLYLHEECTTQIIHCDIKPQNILLDAHQIARISDFGLAKLLGMNQTHTNTAIRGTKGYVAPEWFRNKPVTVKVDVYSFGVLLLEIICCQKNVCSKLIETEGAILIDWALDCYQSDRLSLLVDDQEALRDEIQLKRFVMVALWCIQEDPSLRPTMGTVTLMLQGIVEVPDNLPFPSSFSITLQS